MSTTKEKEEILNYLLENESAFGIIITIMLYGSQNLLNLSKWLQKKSNSLIYHIQKLIEYNLLEIDTQKSQLPGKYYKPTSKALEIMNKDLTIFFEDLENSIKKFMGNKEGNKESIPEMGKIFSVVMNFTKVMSNLWLVNLEPEKLSIKEGKLYKGNNPIGPSLLHVNMINVEDEEDDKKIIEATHKYFTEITKISDEVEKKYKSNNESTESEDDLLSNAKKFRFIYDFSALFDRS